MLVSKAGREKIRADFKISSCQMQAICRQGIVQREGSLVSIFLLLAGCFSNSPPRIVEFYKQTSTELTMNFLTDVLSVFSRGGQEVSGDLLLLFLHCKRVILCLLHNSLDLSIPPMVTGLIIIYFYYKDIYISLLNSR